MTDLLDYIENVSGVIHPIIQIYRGVSFLYKFTRQNKSSALISLEVQDYTNELIEHNLLIGRAILEIEKQRNKVLEELDYLKADRDFIGSQIEIAKSISCNYDFNSSIRGRAAGTVLDLHALLMSRFPASLAINASTPVVMFRPLPLIRE